MSLGVFSNWKKINNLIPNDLTSKETYILTNQVWLWELQGWSIQNP